MFKFHGYSGPCPKPPLKAVTPEPLSEPELYDLSNRNIDGLLRAHGLVGIVLSPDELDRLIAQARDAVAVRAERDALDCRYAGRYADISGSHCPLDKPCVRCRAEQAEAERDRLRGVVEAARAFRDSFMTWADTPAVAMDERTIVAAAAVDLALDALGPVQEE